MALRVYRPPNYSTKHQGFNYQVEAVEAVKNLQYAAIFHEQGLGKTKIGLDLALLWLKNDIVDSVLIVTKKSLIQNWKEEIGYHTFLAPRIIGEDKKANFLAFNSPARFYLTHYEALKSVRRGFQLFLKTRRLGVLLDEAQKIKNPDADITKAALALAPGFTRRLIMTGTPVANRPYDIWAPIYFLDGGRSLGTDFKAFRRDLDLTNDLATNLERARSLEKSLDRLFESISAFSVRETKLSAGITLPDKHIATVYVELADRQAEIYEQFRDELRAIVVQEGRAIFDDAESMLKRLLRLVQVVSNPALVDQSYAEQPCKVPALEALADEAIDAAEKLIVWTSFTENVDWLVRSYHRFGAVGVHGRLPISERNAAIAEFKRENSCRILVATPGAAKEGLTLTVANRAVFFDRSFALDDYLQAQDRIHRISQTKVSLIYNIVARDTVDEWVEALLSAKHLAAQLGQGDITRAQYSERATYEFGEMVREILRLGERGDQK